VYGGNRSFKVEQMLWLSKAFRILKENEVSETAEIKNVPTCFTGIITGNSGSDKQNQTLSEKDIYFEELLFLFWRAN
jgi:hypothetical protein